MFNQALLSIVLENDVLVRLDDGESLVEHVATVLLAHEGLELRELAGGDIDHFFFSSGPSHVAVLPIIV